MGTSLELTSDERSWAMASHVVSFVEGGILAPLFIYMVKRDESEFIAFHALQSVFFGLLCGFVIVFVTILTCGGGIVLVIPYLGFELYATLKANDGEWYMLPIVGDWAYRRHHPKLDP